MSFLIAAAVSGGVSALGKLGSARKQDKAAEEGRKIAYENAANMRLENAETERRAMNDIKKVEGEANLRRYAGGSSGEGLNADTVADALVNENAAQFEWLQVSGETRAKAVERGADYQKMIGEAQADATRWGAVSDIAGSVGQLSYGGAFESWGGKNTVGSQRSWMNPSTVNRVDPLLLTPTNFNIFGNQ